MDKHERVYDHVREIWNNNQALGSKVAQAKIIVESWN